ncbi:rCG48748 [Rattus norvegicus]|uniref:RCG48748 n=1 Tax=Rattus norvegicus TaxID=10116 RepID=A6IG83_RAT|nr:rCG48748 [Rattus norvegicus]
MSSLCHFCAARNRGCRKRPWERLVSIFFPFSGHPFNKAFFFYLKIKKNFFMIPSRSDHFHSQCL